MYKKTSLDQYPPMLSAHEAAEICGCCDRTILNKLRSGELKGIKIGKSWRISRDYLRRLIEGEEVVAS